MNVALGGGQDSNSTFLLKDEPVECAGAGSLFFGGAVRSVDAREAAASGSVLGTAERLGADDVSSNTIGAAEGIGSTDATCGAEGGGLRTKPACFTGGTANARRQPP